MKKNLTYKEHIQNIKDKKEKLPLHKMDDLSRRRFIQNMGLFLGALAVPSMIRLETMSKLSKKILGNSMAFAADAYSIGFAHLSFFFRSGYPSYYTVGIEGHDGTLPTDVNLPWNTGITKYALTGNQKIILGPNAASLAPFATAKTIQSIINQENMGHTSFFPTTVKPEGEIHSLFAASADMAGSTTVLKNCWVMGNVDSYAIQSVPANLLEYTPLAFTQVKDAPALFTPPTVRTSKGTQLSDSLRDQIYALTGSQFQKDVMAGVVQNKADLIAASNEQALTMLKSSFSKALDANDSSNQTIITKLNENLGSRGNFNIMGMDPADAAFTLITGMSKGITPMAAAMIVDCGDQHSNNTAAAGDGAGDIRTQTGAFTAQLMANICQASKDGLFKNPVTGENLKIQCHFFSEFFRGFKIGNSGTDNPDGFSNGVMTVASVPDASVKAGSFGGMDNTGSFVGWDAGTKTHSRNIKAFTSDEIFGHVCDMFKINKEDLNLKRYPSIAL